MIAAGAIAAVSMVPLAGALPAQPVAMSARASVRTRHRDAAAVPPRISAGLRAIVRIFTAAEATIQNFGSTGVDEAVVVPVPSWKDSF